MDEPNSVAELLRLAAAGDEDAWYALVERYSPLLAGVVAGYRLGAAARQDVVQVVWLRLVENLTGLRTPEALPQWLVTTARREAVRVARAQRTVAVDPDLLARTAQTTLPGGAVDPDPESLMLQEERRLLLLAALAELPDAYRRLLLQFVADPPPSYAEVARRLGVPVGSIGPQRRRALDRLRERPVLRALVDAPHAGTR